ncbi:MAG: proteasome assembly chaperone family protein [Candidatus Thorarchaeota archaeon]|nr:MAG: proteasome assembly chaperone family protein [Candidatus Thorarchaeota archaeon]RLI58679.1 MAG: proteasome assembly chaperone family protein [Candidatus Thorarchaeota archaeon]
MAEECNTRVLGSPEAKVVETKTLNLQNPLLVCCFPSAGVVGIMAANTIIEQFEMTEIAHVRSKYIPSAAIFMEGRLRHPFRIYGHEGRNLLVATTELPVAEVGMYAVSSALLDWAAQMGVRETVVLDGIPVQGLPSDRKVLFAAEEEKIPELEKDPGLEIFKKGLITGIAGSILSETLCRDMVGFALLTPAIAVVPDPGAAVQLLEALNRLYGFDIDVSELVQSADQIRKKMEEMARQVEDMRRARPGPSPQGYERMYM